VRRIDAECRPLVEALEHDDLFRATALCNLASNIAQEDPETAVSEMVDAAGPGLERLDASWPTWLLVVMIRSAIALDRLEDAERWAALIEERAAVYELPVGHARALIGRAEVLLAGGDAAAAIPLAREAIAGTEERGYLLDAVPARLLLGRALAAASEMGQAERELREVAARAEEQGAFAFREAAAAELRQIGVRLRGAARSRGGSSDELTDREREIAVLVAEGRSNKQVAAALYLSEKTIEHHLSRVYSKLAVRSRTELAAAWQAT
jgi:DNA-binding CsgD family transcriptional regulator